MSATPGQDADDVAALTAKVERLQAIVNKAREYVRQGQGSDYEALRELLNDGQAGGRCDRCGLSWDHHTEQEIARRQCALDEHSDGQES